MNQEDLRVVKTRENIEHQFILTLKEYSFEELTVKTLVERARINRSTFYRNYLDKYDLLERIQTTQMQHYMESLDASFVMLNYQNAEKYYPSLRKMLHYFFKNKDILLVLWSAKLPSSFYGKMQDVMSESLLKAMAAEYSFSASDESMALLYAKLFAAMTLTTVRWWLEKEPPLAFDDIEKIMTANVEKGLFLSMENYHK